MAPKKRTRRVAGAAAEPQQMVESLREGLRAAHDAQPQIVLAQITTLSEPNPALAQHVLWLLQTGAITMERHSEPEEAVDYLPSSVNKWRLLSVAMSRRILNECCPALSEIWAQLKPNVLSQSVAIALHVDSGSALYSKHIPTLLERSGDRYRACGCRLDNMQNAFTRDHNHYVPNERFGWFSLGEEDDEKTLGCINGSKIALPADLQAHDWLLDKNEWFKSAQIRCGLMAIPCADLFSNIEPPEYITFVVDTASPHPSTPRHGVAPSSSSGSPTSDASSPGVAPPAGSGGAAP